MTQNMKFLLMILQPYQAAKCVVNIQNFTLWQKRRYVMISPEFEQHIINWVKTPDEVHIRRIVETYKDKFPAMASICAITHCEMEEAYKIYDQYKKQLESENK